MSVVVSWVMSLSVYVQYIQLQEVFLVSRGMP